MIATTEINRVFPESIDFAWPEVRTLLASALAHCDGEITVDQLRVLIVRGEAHLFVAHRNDQLVGACAVELVRYPNFTAANVIAIGGRRLMADARMFSELRAELRRLGASKVQGWCPDSVARLWRERLGMRAAYTLMRGEL